jgi:hypothetical protein
MSAPEKNRKKRWLWFAIGVIALIVAVRLVYMIITGPSFTDFSKFRSNFERLGKPYQPDWQIVDETIRREYSMVRPPLFKSDGAEHTELGRPIVQVLASDGVGSGLFRPRFMWAVRTELSMSEDGNEYEVIGANKARVLGECGIRVTDSFDHEKRILSLFITETYRGQSRGAILRYRLTPEGFVAVDDTPG